MYLYIVGNVEKGDKTGRFQNQVYVITNGSELKVKLMAYRTLRKLVKGQGKKLRFRDIQTWREKYDSGFFMEMVTEDCEHIVAVTGVGVRACGKRAKEGEEECVFFRNCHKTPDSADITCAKCEAKGICPKVKEVGLPIEMMYCWLSWHEYDDMMRAVGKESPHSGSFGVTTIGIRFD